MNSIAGLAHACIGLLGYVGYLDDTQGTIFLNMPYNNICNLARAFFSFIVVMTYPIEMLIARDVASSFIRRNQIVEVNATIQEFPNPSWRGKHFIDRSEMMIVMVLNTATLALALIMTDLGVVLTYTGALGGSIACFIMPGAVYLGVYGKEFISHTRSLLSLGNSIHEDNDHTQWMDICTVSKPWWFCILGRDNIEITKLTFMDPIVHDTKMSNCHVNNPNEDECCFVDLPHCMDDDSSLLYIAQPSMNRFIISILLIIFGFVNMTASVIQGLRR